MAHTKLTVDGEDKPSVTEIIDVIDKPYLRRWYGMNGWQACEDHCKKTREEGTAFHESVEKALKFKFGFTPDEPNWDEYVEAVLKWSAVSGFTPMLFERHVVSKKHGYNGTFDCAGCADGKFIIVDWKKTGQIKNEYPIQMSGYDQAHWEETGEHFQQGRVIRPYVLAKEAVKDHITKLAHSWKYSFKGSRVYIEETRYDNLQKYLPVFLCCRTIWDFVNKKGSWKENEPVPKLERRNADVPALGIQ